MLTLGDIELVKLMLFGVDAMRDELSDLFAIGLMVDELKEEGLSGRIENLGRTGDLTGFFSSSLFIDNKEGTRFG